MAISNGNRQFINLNGFVGSGEVGRYKDEVTGVLVGIEPRGGFYQVTDRKTGQLIQRPNSWTAHFQDGSMWSWPTYLDEADGQVKPWSRFDPSINLAECVAQQRVIHVWKDDRNFSHLEVVETKVSMNPNPLPVMTAVPTPAPAVPTVNMPAVAPWERQQ